jgi:hypothetical protein
MKVEMTLAVVILIAMQRLMITLELKVGSALNMLNQETKSRRIQRIK